MKVSREDPNDSPLELSCGSCKRPTKHSILESYKLDGDDSVGTGWSFQWIERYQIVRCRGCETISFRKTESNSEDFLHDDEGELHYPEREHLFPNPIEGRQPLADISVSPSAVQAIYDETLHALNSSQRVLAGIGIRCLIEAVCKDKAASGRDLAQKLSHLVSQGVLTKEGADILQKLRVMGNRAAHEVKPHDAAQLSIAMDVVDHLLEGTYILPHHAKKNFV